MKDDINDHWFKELRKELVECSKDDIGFFSNKNKKEVERIAVAAFLRIMQIDFDPREIIPNFNEEIDKVDVHFRSARFQLMEFLDKDRKRHDEFRQRYNKYINAKLPEDLFFPYKEKSATKIADVTKHVTSALKAKSDKYGFNNCNTIDALVVVNLLDNFLDTNSPLPSPSELQELKAQGWISVSLLQNNCAFIFFAMSSAPDFLYNNQGKLMLETNIYKHDRLYQLQPFKND